MDITRLVDGIDGSVQRTAFNLKVVILPDRILNQKLDLDYSLVFSSITLLCSEVTERRIFLPLTANQQSCR